FQGIGWCLAPTNTQIVWVLLVPGTTQTCLVASIRINGYSGAAVTAAPILDHMAALADPIRCRMLLPLERHELTVNEICSVLQLPQSTVSRHLKTLADDGWVTSRRDGTSRFYGMAMQELDPGAQRLWPLIREQIG